MQCSSENGRGQEEKEEYFTKIQDAAGSIFERITQKKTYYQTC